MQRLLLCVLLLATLLAAAPMFAAEVRSISPERETNQDGTITLTVTVSCAEISDLRVIEKLEGQRKWCSQELPDMCARQKIKAAAKVCHSRYTKRMEEVWAGN